MNHVRIAHRLVEAKKKRRLTKPITLPSIEETVTDPKTEYSCRMEIALSADFEGDVAKNALVKKIKSEILAAIKLGIAQVSKDMNLQSTGVTVQPLRVECAVNDQTDIDDEVDR